VHRNAFCLYASTRDPHDPPDVLPGCGVIIPIAHRPSPFDFTAEEWAATHELLVSGLSCLAFELLEDVLHRLVVADRMGNPAVVVVAYDNDGAIGKPSSVPQTPRPHSAFVHCWSTSTESESA
jgi:hypothetical protein